MERKIMPVKSCDEVKSKSWEPTRFGSSYSTAITQADLAQMALDDAMEKDTKTHDENSLAIENNRAICAYIESVMNAIGMPKTNRIRDAKSRSIYPKYKTEDAGYIRDMQMNIPVTDGYNDAKLKYDAAASRIAQFKQAALAEAEKAKAAKKYEAERAMESQKYELKKAQIILRYSLDPDKLWTWSDILDNLRARDQRLDLAVAMAQTRGDWSDGYYRVSDALGCFEIKNDEDKEIVVDVSRHLHDDDIDGRVFRDTVWNYDRLFSTAKDQQLSADVQDAMNNVRD